MDRIEIAVHKISLRAKHLEWQARKLRKNGANKLAYNRLNQQVECLTIINILLEIQLKVN